MNVQQQGVLTLIRCGLTGEKLPLPDGFDLEEAYKVLRQHQILGLAYTGALNCGISKQQPIMNKLFLNYCRYLQYSEQQSELIQTVCATFDEAGVDYMPLKGCNLKQLYPAPELRAMGDVDILIKVKQYGTIEVALKMLGFSEVNESDHELIWEKGSLVLELHKRLIPSYNRDYYRYFGDGWRLAKECQGTRYRMNGEDEFVYLFTHFAKHYRDGGIGLRHLADLWVYLHAYPELDMVHIRKELECLKLLAFFENVKKTFDAWLGDGQWDDMSRFVMSHVFASGAYGTREEHELSSVARVAQGHMPTGKARFVRYFGMVFPSLEEMKERYPVLNRVPVLLPVCWILRGIKVLLFRRDTIDAFADKLRMTGGQAVDTYQQELDFVGLNFDFEE